MSVINKMLRDLDARRPDDLHQPGRPQDIRPVPEARRPLAAFLAGGGLAAAMAAGWLWWWPAAAPLQPVVAATVPVLPPGPPAVAPVAPPPAAGVAAGAVSEILLRVSSRLENLPSLGQGGSRMPQDEKPPRDRKAPAAESPDAAPGLASVIAPGSQPQAAAAAGASKAAADARVEKTPALMTARDRADAAMQRAQAHLAAGRRAEGVESLESALAHDRDHGQARQLLIRAYLEQKRGNEAMAALEAGIALQPQRIAWAMSLARLQVDVGDLASAQKTLAHSFPFAAGSADYAGFFGHVQHRLGQHGQAVDLLQAAIRLAPGEGRWWLGLAAVLEDTGRQEEAKTAYRRALATGSLSAELVALAERQAR